MPANLPNPRIVEHPQDGYVAKDEPASLNCRAEGEPKPNVTWYRNGEKVITSPENPFSNRMIFPGGKLFFLSVVHNKKDKTDVGVYYCNATNVHGSAISRNATLSIAGKPKSYFFWGYLYDSSYLPYEGQNGTRSSKYNGKDSEFKNKFSHNL